ncbi:MAG: hypothetical protein KBF51_08745 [Chitinophagales bacterium]|nr:hypothetical protein [Chitinophagales bacterium]MBP9705224.1 hypothetical protein [Chitinophagales bacterium]
MKPFNFLPPDPYPFGMLTPGRNWNAGSEYRFGFGGQEEVHEVSGNGNSYTAEFWQYDPRLGRRWNIDPKPNPSWSSYSTFSNNPIFFTDILGDTVKTSQEGNKILQEGLTASLGANNPFGYNEEKGKVTMDNNFDRTKYNEDQLFVIDHLGGVVNSEKVNELMVVDFNEPIAELNNMSLGESSLNGATLKTGEKTWVARNPKTVGVVENPNYNSFNIYSERYINGLVAAPSYLRGLNTLHEIGGHAYYRFTQPQIISVKHADIVEAFETVARQVYQIGTYETKKEVKRAKKAGLDVQIGDPKYLGGKAEKHTVYGL